MKKVSLFLIAILLLAIAGKMSSYSEDTVQERKEVSPVVKTKQEKIDSQFSGWDGSHIQFEKLVKLSMNDPKSFEHIETKYWEYDDYIVVLTRFRGRNAFGGIVADYAKAKYSIDGKLIQIM